MNFSAPSIVRLIGPLHGSSPSKKRAFDNSLHPRCQGLELSRGQIRKKQKWIHPQRRHTQLFDLIHSRSLLHSDGRISVAPISRRDGLDVFNAILARYLPIFRQRREGLSPTEKRLDIFCSDSRRMGEGDIFPLHWIAPLCYSLLSLRLLFHRNLQARKPTTLGHHFYSCPALRCG
jgi:hypothetical protein